MAYKILINSKGVPVLVEYFEQSITMDYMQNPPKDITKEFNERLLQSAIADESKHIAFKDEFEVWKIMGKANYFEGLPMVERKGQTFDLPDNVGVSFEEEQYIESETENSFTIGYRKLAILTPKENSAHSFTEGSDVPESVPSCGEKVKTTEDAWEIQETYEGKPHGWVQWKGTDVCMDVHCKCGELTHIDGDFVYHVKCANCGTVYMVNGHVQLIELEIEPEGTKITTND